MQDSSSNPGARGDAAHLRDVLATFAVLPPNAFVRLPVVEALSGCPRSTLYREISLGRFPRPVKLTGQHVAGWRVGDVRAWLEAPAEWRSEAA